MSRNIPEIPTSAIDGFLEVTIGGLYAGMEATANTQHVLETIQRHEEWIIRKQNRRRSPDIERLASAQYHLGQIAAVSALINVDIPAPKLIGF